MSDDGLPIEGVDYAFGKHPSPAALVAAGKKFVIRYGGPGTEDKWIHADEAQALARAGIWIVANAEGSTSGLTGGFSAGVAWATSALAWFRSIGMPKGRPIYFSVDFDTTTGDWDELEAAMDGCASVIGREQVGVYGEYSIVAHLIGKGKARWAWETYAWSGQQWFAGNHLEQYHNGVYIDGADCDLDRAMRADYGQWMPGITPTISKGATQMSSWFGQVGTGPQDAASEVYVLTGTQTRYMPPGTWATTCKPLIERGMALLYYPSMDDLLKAGGPLVDDDAVPVAATLNAASLAEAMRAMVTDVVRTELDKTRLAG